MGRRKSISCVRAGIRRAVAALIIGAIASAGCGRAPADATAAAVYFGQTPPGDTPIVFAPGVISRVDRFEQFLNCSPDGRVVIFGVTNDDWSSFTLLQTTLEDGVWTEAATAPFLGSRPSGLTAALSPDGATAYFTDARPTYPPGSIWRSERMPDGWSEPVDAGPPLSSEANKWELTIAANGTVYFSSAREGGEGDLDIFRARLVGGRYGQAENLGPPVNTAAGDDLPYIAPDESYLIFASNRHGGLGERDLYISFQIDGAWTEPENLGAPINSAFWDIYPSVSPDGRYLFFTRRVAWNAGRDSDILWASAAFIERLRSAR